MDVPQSDAVTHQLALYAVDFDHNGRDETVTILDDATGAVLDTRSLSSFGGGAYLVWSVQGNVTFQVTSNNAQNAVVSGLFFGTTPTPQASATFDNKDTTTQGTWKGVYGADGFSLSSDPSANNPTIPAYATLALVNAQSWVWASSTTDVRALQRSDTAATDRLAAACWAAYTQLGFDVHLTDGNTHQLSLYAVDYDHRNRDETFTVYDDATGVAIDSRRLSSFDNGAYLTWSVKGNVTIAITSNGGPNAVVSGLFFDTSASSDVDDPPVIVTPAAASNSDVTGDSTNLSVLARVKGDASNLTYTWTAIASPRGAFFPMLTDNNSVTANNTTATFSMAGDYTFRATADNNGLQATSDVTVTVEQTPTSIFVSPPSGSVVQRGNTKQFTTTVQDQFDHQIDSPPSVTWTVSNGSGSINSSGLFSTTSNSSAGESTINVSSGQASASLKVEVTDQDLIDFSDLAVGTVITNQYAQATFSCDSGLTNEKTDFFGVSAIGTFPPSPDPARFNRNLYVDFTLPVKNLMFETVGVNNQSGTIGQVRVYQNGSYTVTVPMSAHGTGYIDTVDLSAYDHVSRIEIVNVTDPAGLWYSYFQFSPDAVNLIAHRTGDFQGQTVSDQIKLGGDPSKYVILTDNNYTLADGTAALAADTAEIPGSNVAPISGPAAGSGDNDLAKITLQQIPTGLTHGKVKIVLSDPTAVRLFKPDGTLLFADGTTGTNVLTLDLASPSGYLAGLESGNLDVWLEGKKATPDFDFAVFYEDDQGRVVSDDNVHITIADWTFRDYADNSLDAVDPLWESALLAELQLATQSSTPFQVSQIPGDYFFKNQIDGLSSNIAAQIQVTSADVPSDTYVDDLARLPDQAVSNHFAALYGSEDILAADPDPTLSQTQRDAILSVLGLNVVHNQETGQK